MKIGDRWYYTCPVPHAVPTRSLLQVVAMEHMLNGEWKNPVNYADDLWWEDMKLLSGDGYWDMEGRIRLGNWRMI